MFPSVFPCSPHAFSKVSCNFPSGSLACKKMVKLQHPSLHIRSPLGPAWECPGQLVPDVKCQGYKSPLLISMGPASPVPNNGVYEVRGLTQRIKGAQSPKKGLALDCFLKHDLWTPGISCLIKVSLFTWGINPRQVVWLMVNAHFCSPGTQGNAVWAEWLIHVCCGPPIHGIFWARMLEWVAIFCSRGSFWPRHQTCTSCVPCIAGRFFTHWATGESRLCSPGTQGNAILVWPLEGLRLPWCLRW